MIDAMKQAVGDLETLIRLLRRYYSLHDNEIASATDTITALRTAIEAAERTNGGGKQLHRELFDAISAAAHDCSVTRRVDWTRPPMQNLMALVDAVCVRIDSPPPPAITDEMVERGARAMVECESKLTWEMHRQATRIDALKLARAALEAAWGTGA